MGSQIRASAPGSLMLFGEHAVLHGYPALSAAIDKRITARIQPRSDQRLIVSSGLGRFETRINGIADDDRFRFVTAALRCFEGRLPSGCTLTIDSEIPSDIGFGSSAAVMVAVLGAINVWISARLDHAALHRMAVRGIRQVQGSGSGADAAASIFGGVVQVWCDPIRVLPLDGIPALTVVYSGSKMKTPDVIAHVERLRAAQPEVFDRLFAAIGQVADTAASRLDPSQQTELGQLANIAEALMRALDLENRSIREILNTLRDAPGIAGAKISGAGLGDCVIGIGGTAAPLTGLRRIATAISGRGLEVEGAADPGGGIRKRVAIRQSPLRTQREVVSRIVPACRTAASQAAATAFAPANIALVKYWGKRDTELNLPVTGSLSLSLGKRGSEVCLSRSDGPDRVSLNGRPLLPDTPFARRLTGFLDVFRPAPDFRYCVAAVNTVPTAAGLASSASGFAALVRALDRFHGWGLDPRMLSILARLGSGSACRSMYEGLVEWHAGSAPDGMDSYAEPLAMQWPELRIGLLIVNAAEKTVGSREAMLHTVETSRLYRSWPAAVADDLARIKHAIAARDFECFGAVIEGNALTMHATMLAARPAVCYWIPETLRRIGDIQNLRQDGLPVYFTMDAGPNLKLIYLTGHESAVRAAFPDLS